MRRPVQLFFAVVLAASAAPAVSQSSPAIAAARQAGIVGERFDGYLGFAARPSEEVRRQTGAINIKRRSLYTGLATRRGVTVEAVGIAAGCELLAQVAVGEAYMLNDGRWRRRLAGQPAPVPSYCGR
ncbi:MAG: YdbL family protein [Alphaproteobacteria bacterium]